jgi:hypothetical protein
VEMRGRWPFFRKIRALDEKHRMPLITQYQSIFRDVRAFFGDCDDPARKLLLAGTQLLNESLFWSVTWLKNYSFGDFGNVRAHVRYSGTWHRSARREMGGTSAGL